MIEIPWARRAAELHREVAAVAEIGRADPRWWLLAAGAAVVEPWPARGAYSVADAEPGADTFMAYRARVAPEPIGQAIMRAYAARDAIRTLDGTLPDQPLAVTLECESGARPVPSKLDYAAFAIGERVIVAPLGESAIRSGLGVLLADAVREGSAAPRGIEHYERVGDRLVLDMRGSAVPFVAVALGDDPLAVARHGHRRAWRDGRGPWLGLGSCGDLAIVSASHLAIDGFGHAQLANAIASDQVFRAMRAFGHGELPIPPLAAPAEVAAPLGVAWRALDTRTDAIRLAYAVGTVLHARVGRPDAAFSPTLQIPVAPGDPRGRSVSSITSVRFADGKPEPYAEFAARTREILDREAHGTGLCARMHAAARATPAPLAWKRRQFSATRPRWLHRISEVLGGRACVSRIEGPGIPLCAVSSPSRLATRGDPLGACVITLVDHAHARAPSAITACGSGLAGTPADADALLDDVLSHL